MVTVSIVIPFYNGKRFLESCQECLVNQSYKDIEWIWVDDGSTDGGGDYLEILMKGKGHCRIIHKENSGLSDSRRVGLAAAHGKYVYFLDVDDFLFADAIQKAVWTAENLDLDIVSFGSWNVREETPTVRFQYEIEMNDKEKSPYQKRSLKENRIYSGLEYVKASLSSKEGLCPPVWLNLYRTDFLKNSQIAFVPVIHEDMLFTIDALLAAKRAGHIDQVLHARRMSSGSLMNRKKTIKHVEGMFAATRHASMLYRQYKDRPDLRKPFQRWNLDNAWLLYTDLRACPFKVRKKVKYKALFLYLTHPEVTNAIMLAKTLLL